MYKEKYEALKLLFDDLRDAHDKMAARLAGTDFHTTEAAPPPTGAENGGGSRPIATASPADLRWPNSFEPPKPVHGAPSLNDIYVYVLERARTENPQTLRLLLERPEIEVRRERKTIALDAGNLKGSLAVLLSEGFFDTAVEFADVRRELIRRGMLGVKAPNQQISQSLQSIVEMGFLTKESTGAAGQSSGYRAVPGMRVHIVETAAK
jgi:hypothetical protein